MGPEPRRRPDRRRRQTRTTSVSLGGDCEPPDEPDPSVGTTTSAATNGIDIELINNGTADAVFTVNGTDTTVGPNSSTTVTVAAAENETVHITITSGGATLLDDDVTRDCLDPGPELGTVNECATGGIDVQLVNTGADSATFTVNGTDTTVGPNSSTTVTVAAAENETVAHHDHLAARRCSTTTSPGTASIPVLNWARSTSAPPAASTCSWSTPAPTAPRSRSNGTDTTVGPNSSTTVTVAAAENETVHITITSSGATLLDDDVTRDCLDPGPGTGTVNECATGGIDVQLVNTGA